MHFLLFKKSGLPHPFKFRTQSYKLTIFLLWCSFTIIIIHIFVTHIGMLPLLNSGAKPQKSFFSANLQHLKFYKIDTCFLKMIQIYSKLTKSYTKSQSCEVLIFVINVVCIFKCKMSPTTFAVSGNRVI